jgi:hypothetical protein
VIGGPATGTPVNPIQGAVHCGVYGVPNGDYFMAQYIVDGPGVAVTPVGCYEYCQVSSPFFP